MWKWEKWLPLLDRRERVRAPLDLLQRFYDPGGGVIRLDGVDLRERSLAAVRAGFGFVPQDLVLFS